MNEPILPFHSLVVVPIKGPDVAVCNAFFRELAKALPQIAERHGVSLGDAELHFDPIDIERQNGASANYPVKNRAICEVPLDE